jgi:hypothetical protein
MVRGPEMTPSRALPGGQQTGSEAAAAQQSIPAAAASPRSGPPPRRVTPQMMVPVSACPGPANAVAQPGRTWQAASGQDAALEVRQGAFRRPADGESDPWKLYLDAKWALAEHILRVLPRLHACTSHLPP